jgi:hypothetical protein
MISSHEDMPMETEIWQLQRVLGRDEVLLDVEKRAYAYSEAVVQDIRAVMHDYEVDMYRLVLSIGKRYGMDKAFEIMSDTVAEKRLKWLDQVFNELELSGSEIEKALELYRNYFRSKTTDFEIIEQERNQVIFRRKDFVDAIFHACAVLGLDVIEVNNKVYARAMNRMLERIDPRLEHSFIGYEDGWYQEKIVLHAEK